MSQQISVLSQTVSVLSQAVSVLSVAVAAAAAPQVRVRGATVSVISGTARVDIASMVLSMTGGAGYAIDGFVAWEAATSTGVGFGCSTPALAAAGSFIHMWLISTPIQTGAPGAHGIATFSAIAAGQTTIVSAANIGTINVLRGTKIEGFLAVSATGTFRMMGKTSAVGASLSVRGGWLRAFKVY